MKFNPTILFLLLALAIVLGVVLVPLMDNDAAHHAAIALNMTESGDYVTLTDVMYGDGPYFDKPHLQFWLVATSFAFFGVGGVVYKLSSLVFVLLSLFSTYKLGEYLTSNSRVGVVSTLVLASMMAFLLGSSVDIRMDAILSGAVIFGIWQGVLCIGGGGNRSKNSGKNWRERFNIWNYLGLALGLALAFSCKGLYGVVVIGAALFFYMMGIKRLHWLFSWRFLVALGLFAVMILPELWAFYEQFGWSGVRFMLYDQILIRTEGGMGVSGESDPFFFIHTLLWVVLPWSALLFVYAFRSLFTSRFDSIYWLTIPSSVLVIVLLSFSSFKLPHYLNPLFPLFAIFLGQQLFGLRAGTRQIKGVAITQKIVVALMIVVGAMANYWVFAFDSLWLAILVGMAFLYFVYQLFTAWESYEKIVTMSVAAAAVLWIGLNSNFYPQLLDLQAGNQTALVLKERGIKPSEVFLYKPNDYNYSASFDIHHGGLHKRISKEQIEHKAADGQRFYLFVTHAAYDELREDSLLNFSVLTSQKDYRITRLTQKFLDPSTRSSVIDTMRVVQFN